MAFETAEIKIKAVGKAGNLLGQIRTLYTFGKNVQAALALYQAGTDPAFNAAVDALFSGAERAELGVMLGNINTLVTTWEANHAAALRIE
jgi:hypothetical protein